MTRICAIPVLIRWLSCGSMPALWRPQASLGTLGHCVPNVQHESEASRSPSQSRPANVGLKRLVSQLRRSIAATGSPFKWSAAEQVGSSSSGTLPCCPRCFPDLGGLPAANSVSFCPQRPSWLVPLLGISGSYNPPLCPSSGPNHWAKELNLVQIVLI
jgi:hypothetical protein